MARSKSADVLTRRDAKHMQAQDGDSASLRAQILHAEALDLLGSRQAPAAAAGFLLVAIILVPLSFLIDARAVVPPGFAPMVTASSSALVVGALLVSLGVGGLSGAIVGLVLDLRMTETASYSREAVVVDEEQLMESEGVPQRRSS